MTDITKPRIYLDRSGDLRTGYFYLVEFEEGFFPNAGPPVSRFVNLPKNLLDQLTEDPRRLETGEVVVKRSPSRIELIRKQGVDYFSVLFETSFDLQAEQRKDCPVDPTHVTQAWWKDLKVLAVDKDDVAAPFVQLNGDQSVLLIRDDLLQALKKSKLTGWQSAEVILATQDGEELGRTSNPRGYPKMWYFQFRGRARLRPRSVRNAPNACPFCGHGQIICPGCGLSMIKCPKCEGFPYATPARARELGKDLPKGTLIREDTPEGRKGILQGEHWDGRDFILIGQTDFGYPFMSDKHIITRRALDWLLAHRAMPIWARPIPVDVSRMSKQQLEKLEAAKDPKSLE